MKLCVIFLLSLVYAHKQKNCEVSKEEDTIEQAHFCEMPWEILLAFPITVTGWNGRFNILHDNTNNEHWCYDTFHEQEKKLIIDASEIRLQIPEDDFFENNFCLAKVHFIDERSILVISDRPRRYLLSGTFELVTCTIKLSVYHPLLEGYVHDFAVTLGSLALLETNSNSIRYTPVNLKSSFNFENRVDIENTQHLTYTTCRDGVLIGFNDRGFEGTELMTLISISLSDGSVTKSPVKCSNEDKLSLKSGGHCWIWIKDKLFTHSMVSNQETSIFVFDLKAMEWKNTGIRFGEGVLRMSSAEENMLIVKVDGPNFNSDIRLYRFPMCRPDSLLNISWMKVRRWAKTKPVLYEETIQKLPHNLPVRCPWQNNL